MVKKDQILLLRGLQLNPRLLVYVLILQGHAKFVGQKHKIDGKWSSAENLNADFMSKNWWEGKEEAVTHLKNQNVFKDSIEHQKCFYKQIKDISVSLPSQL